MSEIEQLMNDYNLTQKEATVVQALLTITERKVEDER